MPTVKDLLKLLDLEMEEEFYIYDNQEDKIYDYIYKFTADDLYWYDEVHYLWKSSIRDILDFFRGRYTIVKKPWKPKFNDRYYFVTFCHSGNVVDSVRCCNDIYDYSSYAMGNCFRTKEEAEAHKEEIINYLKSTYEKGNISCDIK